MPRGPELPPYIRERICELKRFAKWGAKRIQKHSFPNIPLSTIHYTLRQEAKRCHGLSISRSGAPRKLTAEDRDHLYKAIQNNPCITREDLLTEVDYKVKANSIWRLTHEMGLRKWRKLDRLILHLFMLQNALLRHFIIVTLHQRIGRESFGLIKQPLNVG